LEIAAEINRVRGAGGAGCMPRTVKNKGRRQPNDRFIKFAEYSWPKQTLSASMASHIDLPEVKRAQKKVSTTERPATA
jgi:hypothetical protein